MTASISPVLSLWSAALRRLRLCWWQWARHELQLQNPAHPDLPLIVRRIRELS